MSMEGIYNLKSPAVKRLMREAEELKCATEEYFAQPLEDNLFEWHFTVRGPINTDFDGGVYHGRITLPPDYPMKPPSIILLTPNGRFEINKKICLSISGHHPESWQPSWSIRTALLAIIGFMPTQGNGAIGSLDYTPEERRSLARKSQRWRCSECGLIRKLVLDPSSVKSSKKPESKEQESSGQVPDQLPSTSAQIVHPKTGIDELDQIDDQLPSTSEHVVLPKTGIDELDQIDDQLPIASEHIVLPDAANDQVVESDVETSLESSVQSGQIDVNQADSSVIPADTVPRQRAVGSPSSSNNVLPEAVNAPANVPIHRNELDAQLNVIFWLMVVAFVLLVLRRLFLYLDEDLKRDNIHY